MAYLLPIKEEIGLQRNKVGCWRRFETEVPGLRGEITTCKFMCQALAVCHNSQLSNLDSTFIFLIGFKQTLYYKTTEPIVQLKQCNKK